MLPETVKLKCLKFFTVIIKLVKERQSEKVVANVRKLIQDLIDGTLSPEVFTAKLAKELTSAPKPHLVPFLKKSLPCLRHSLITKEVRIEGVNPPPPTAPMLPMYTPPLSRNRTIRPFLSRPVSTTANSSSATALTTQLPRPTEEGQAFIAQLIMSIKREIAENPSAKFPHLTISQIKAGNDSDVFQIKTEKLRRNSQNRQTSLYSLTANSSLEKKGQVQFGTPYLVATTSNSLLRSILPAPAPQLTTMPLRDQNINAPQVCSPVLSPCLPKIPAVLSSEPPKPNISISLSVQNVKPELSDLAETTVTPVASVSTLTGPKVESVASTSEEKVVSATSTVDDNECSCRKRKRATESPETIDNKIVEIHDYLKELKKPDDSTMLFLKSIWRHLKQLPEEEENRKRIKIMQCLFD